MGTMTETRRRCVWLEVRNGRKVICVSRGLPARAAWTFADLDIFAVVKPPAGIRGAVLGSALNRVIEALEYAPDDKLGQIVNLLEAGFLVMR